MDQNYSSTKAPTVAATAGGGKFGASPWSNPDNIKVNDAASATWGAFSPGQGAGITGSVFAFPSMPSSAVIDGIAVTVIGSVSGGVWGTVMLNIAGATTKDIGALNQTYGGSTDKWGKSSITPTDIANLAVTVDTNDVSGGDAFATIQYLTITVYWHIEPTNIPADVPTRVIYKVYSRNKKYLGDLPNVKSVLAFPQEINSAGSLLDITCATDLRNVTTTEKLLTESGLDILTEDDLPIYAEFTDLKLAAGSSPDDALFKNSNIIKAYLYNYWFPNGKLMFTGQVNRIGFTYGSSSDYVNLKVYSEGYDLSNYIARGFPFVYTADVTQGSSGSSRESYFWAYGAWNTWGQSWRTGAAVTNLAALTLRLNGAAVVKLNIYDQVNGNIIGTVTKTVNTAGAWVDTQFEFPTPITVTPNTNYFFAVWLTLSGADQSMQIASSATDVYANGMTYNSSYSGGSGGGSFGATTGDLYFITYSGTPTTITTYATQDPVTSTMDKILTDYNNRGGKIKKRTFVAAGYNVTYTFNMASVFDAMKKVIELSPRGYYAYVDLGQSVLDIGKVGTTADFTVVKGRDLNSLDIAMTTEQIENYLLFIGGETGGVNLFREYKSSASVANYGLRTKAMSDNRVTVTATADALGNAFIAENSEEAHETKITVLNKNMDITLLTPGKTIGFRNFGNLIDLLILQIVRREYSPDSVTLTLGQLPVNLTDEVADIMRGLLNEQTAKNPASPS